MQPDLREQPTKRPPVDWLGVSFLSQYLRGKVLRRSTNTFRFLGRIHVLFGESKIGDNAVSVAIN